MKITLTALLSVLCSKKRTVNGGEICVVYLGDDNFLLHSSENNQEFSGSLIYENSCSEIFGPTIDWRTHLNETCMKVKTADAISTIDGG